MTALAKAYDNIRLLRRKVEIAQAEDRSLLTPSERDKAMVHLNHLKDDLVRALNDFADLGFEEEIAEIIHAIGPLQAVKHYH